VPVPQPPSISLGIQDDGQLRNGNMQGLDEGRALHARSLRLVVPADAVRTSAGYDFSRYDAIVNAARAKGLAPQLVLDTDASFGAGGDPRKFAAFAQAAAAHFRGRVGRYSLINEPDLRMRPAKYRELYVLGRKGVKASDPGAQLLFGEFSNRDPIGYSKKVLARGGLQAEGFALHPYQFTTDPLAPGEHAGSIGRLGHVEQGLQQLGLRTPMGRTPGMFLTEFGYRTRGDASVSQEQAAAWWPRALRKAESVGARQIIAYHMSEETNPNSSWDTSLVDTSGLPRPAYDALRSAIAATNKRRVLRRKR
jgi:hypothetical protein